MGCVDTVAVTAAPLISTTDAIPKHNAATFQSLFNITGAVVVSGLSAGMETFCGQAMGAGNYKMLGVVLQRALLICLAAAAPITLLLWRHIEGVLVALGQPPAIAAGAAQYLWRVAPALWLMALTECLKRCVHSLRLRAAPCREPFLLLSSRRC